VVRGSSSPGSSAVQEHAGDHETRLLAPRERATGLSTSSPENWKAPRSARSVLGLEREVVLHLLEQRPVRIEQIERLLREVAHL